VDDGSIDDDNGFEINTSPAHRDTFKEQITEWGELFRISEAKPNSSCGLHIHISANDFDWLDIKKLVKLYERIELALFSLVPKSRRNNRYCRPCGERFTGGLDSISDIDSKYRLQLELIGNTYLNPRDYTVSKRIKDSEKRDTIFYFPSNKKERRPDARYMALNLHSWLYRKTIECRLFNGTVTPSNIINWAYLWEAILNTAYYLSEKEIDYLVENTLCTTRERLRILHSNFSQIEYGIYTTQIAKDALESQLDLLKLISPSEDVTSWIEKRYKQFTC